MAKYPTSHIPIEHRDNPKRWMRVETFKADRRVRTSFNGNLPGWRLVDTMIVDEAKAKRLVASSTDKSVKYKLHSAYELKRNLMTGKKYWEATDTPFYCSPASEAYWTM